MRTRAILALVAVSALAACSTTKTPPPGVEIRWVDRVVEVQKPCPATRPERPAPLARPLPADANALAAVLLSKLIEYAGSGMYADRAEAALDTCLTP
ncbi:hypothetical protein DFR49_3344 [Hephaestia caeni]|uniref:Lipoprotein n=1 Tax=Hephaestia caeni TaxID=645617 RepID=A0A397NP64_9SPHN|nr:hypothetical protein [Hephaestia caeni]RIA37459.1 hypothetical protein DFR49_3344 [Hephaestia caeni]